MAEQIYFEDVEEGSEIPTLRKDPTTQQLVKYAGASGDYYQIHYDKGFALNNNLPMSFCTAHSRMLSLVN